VDVAGLNAAGLNAAQAEAVKTLSGPLLVLAGAGTGKTRVVTYRIAALIRSGIPAQRILAVTFTNKAAAEMQQRAGALLGNKTKAKPEISTFHSLCVRILRRHIQRLGYPASFAIYDRGDQEGTARAVLRQIRVPGESLRPGDLLGQISRWKSAGMRPDVAATAAVTDKEHLAASAYRRYQRELKTAGAVDFDDLLLLAEELLDGFADVRQAEARRFDHLLIDEYQDTNASQYRLVRALAGEHRNLCVVGDDDQSIYGWRGAEVSHILNFRRDWPGAKVVRLEENYRSTGPILSWANRLIAFNSKRHGKTLRPARHGGEPPKIWQAKDEEEEAKLVVADIARLLQQPGREPRDCAILFRTNEQPRPFEMELRRAGLPYVVIGGMSFYDRREVRDVMAYLRLLAYPHDEASLLRIINRPARGIGHQTVAALMAKATETGTPLWQVLRAPQHVRDAAPTAQAAVERLVALIEQFRGRLKQAPASRVATELLEVSGYRQQIERNYDQPQEQEARWQALEQLVNWIAKYEARVERPTLSGFLDEAALTAKDSPEDQQAELKRNAVALLTLHSAKGLEFPQVYLVGMEEGILPHRRALEEGDHAIDEERRLCYVGMTRAQDRLVLVLPLSRMKWGKPRKTIPSRFLFEATGKARRAGDPARRDAGRPRLPGRHAKPADGAVGSPPGNPSRRPRRN